MLKKPVKLAKFIGKLIILKPLNRNSLSMAEIATSERQMTLFCNAESSIAKQTIAHAKAERVSLLVIDLLKTKLTGTQLVELADKLGMAVKDLVAMGRPAFKKKFGDVDFSTFDWLTAMRENPEIIKQPIALKGKKILLIETPSDILKLDRVNL